MAGTLDPEARAVLERLAVAGTAPIERLTPEQARADYEAATLALAGAGEDVAEVHDRDIAGPGGPLPLRGYWPRGSTSAAGTALPVLVWLHGGGWVVGSLDSHDALCRRLANQAGCIVVAVGYRLAPEHPFPAAVQDCLAAVAWVHEHAPEAGGDPQRLAVGGDSAGGALAAAVARRLGARISMQVLAYPITDSRLDRRSYERYGRGYGVTRADVGWSWRCYAPAEGAHPDAAPLRAEDLAGSPPALICVAGCDPLHDDGAAYADKLSAAGVAVELVEFSGQIHGFARWLQATPDASGRLAERIAAALARRWRAPA